MINTLYFKKIRLLFAAVVALLFAFSCANVVAPTGGPKDITPPTVLRSNPANYSTNFTGKTIRFYFDEYVELKNINQKLLISPPLKTQPEFRLRGKSIVMEINPDELKPNTTYNIFFDDAVADLNEGNAIQNFRFVFSTGDFLDSLSVRGNVFEAFSLMPVKNTFVMLFDSIYDSVPYLEKPVYVSKTNDKGDFEISFVKSGEYKMFALEDINSSYTFDLPTERIAFFDSLISPTFLGHPHKPIKEEDATIENIDSVLIETSSQRRSLRQEADTVEVDDIIMADEVDVVEDSVVKPELQFYKLALFLEEDTVQKISSVSMTQKNLMMIVFRVAAENPSFIDIRQAIDHKEYFQELSKSKDSLFVWFNDFERDSLFIEISDRNVIVDTVSLSTEFRERVQRGRAPREEVKKIAFKNNIASGGILAYFDNLEIYTNNPIKEIDNSKVLLFKNDTIQIEASLEVFGSAQRKLRLNTVLEQESIYKLLIVDSCITDIYGFSHDTLKLNFKTDGEEIYGKIILNLTIPDKEKQYVLQLIDDKKELIKEEIITTSGLYVYPNLKAGKYGFKLIEDKNRDCRWTSGRYLKGIQPEVVMFYNEQIQLRQNWEMEVTWNLDKDL
ncbi:MAG: Ig-like domain-containing protein [Bacteroidetes bacterium]|nr:Ig-like domain-containing protein [Bacteroidota bacterium]